MGYRKPYYIVTFISKLRPDSDGYNEMTEKMLKLSKEQDGFLGMESTRDSSGKGITVSYWQNMESIKKWKDQPEHKVAQDLGRNKWYESFSVEISRVD